MPIGSRAGGFTYLLLLFALAIGGAGLAALGGAWATATQRGKEAELLFRGGEFSRAFASYQRSTPAGVSAFPGSLEELLDDRRAALPARHLRRLYADPFTGSADCVAARRRAYPRPAQPLAGAPVSIAARRVAERDGARF